VRLPVSFKVIIADDEPLARQIIRDYLVDYPDFNIVCECDNGKDTLHAVKSYHPDVVFLDIQMPELNGIEVVENMEWLPHFVFSTAYDEYAIRAFELNAFDYLLKPYDAKRFNKTMVRLEKDLRQGRHDVNKIEALLSAFRTPSYPERILVPSKDQLVFIRVKDILYAEALENYVSIVTSSETYILLQKISELMKRLNPQEFFPIHRSYIVNVNQVQKIAPWRKGSYRVVLKNDKILPLSRRKVKDFKTRFGI
jgi:two-component system LytT family response regulator